MPHLPATRLVQSVSMLLPRGETTPSPVMTTRRSVQLTAIKNRKGQRNPALAGRLPRKSPRALLGPGILDVFDHIAHALKLFGFLVRDLVAKFFFQGHDQLNGVEGVSAQVFDEF